MPVPPKVPRDRAAKPTREIFDAFNSSSTGHQRAENRLSGSTSWRDSRSAKLAEQFSAGLGGGKRLQDTVGAGSADFGRDGRTANGGWLPGTKGLRGQGQSSLWESFGSSDKGALKVAKVRDEERVGVERKLVKGLDELEEAVCAPADEQVLLLPRTSQESYEEALLASPTAVVDDTIHVPQAGQDSTGPAKNKQIFRNLTIYINGSTAPLISDHKLKRLLVEHGANVSIALGRRTVTHVVLGHANSSASTRATTRGAGGGLASSKIQKEITKIRNCGGNAGVKFVSVEWVVESIRAGKRLPESRFECLRLAPNGVKRISSIFRSI